MGKTPANVEWRHQPRFVYFSCITSVQCFIGDSGGSKTDSMINVRL